MGFSWRIKFCNGNPEPKTQNLNFKRSCKICLNSVKRSQGKAIYTAECGHVFHFACLATHIPNHTTFLCPVCNATWKDLSLLAPHNTNNNNLSQQNDVVENTTEIQTTQQQQQQPPPPPPPQPTHSDTVIRSYNDDEPLPSPNICTLIVPIPEADENAEQDDQNDDASQSQRILVNPQQTNDADSRSLQVKLMPDCAVLSLSSTHVTYALVLKIKAPPPPAPPQRSSIDLVAVLGVGGNMRGPKLHMLKRAMRFVISSLGSADRLAIVSFSATSKRLLPFRRMTASGRRVARRVVEKLVCGGNGNNVGEAMMIVAKVLEDRRARNPVTDVILLTDGHEERAQTSDSTNQRRCFVHVSSCRFTQIEVPVHWFGLRTKARHDYNPGKEVQEDDLAKCMGTISSVVVTDLRVQLRFEPGSAETEISSVYSCSGSPTEQSCDDIVVGNMYGEKEKDMVVEVRVATTALGAQRVMKVRCMYKDPSGNEVVVHDKEEEVTVELPPRRGVSCNGRVERVRNMLITKQAMAESKRLVKEEKISSACDLVASARALILMSGSGSGQGQEIVRTLEGELLELHRLKQQTTVREIGGRGHFGG